MQKHALQNRLSTNRRIKGEDLCQYAHIDKRLFIRAVDRNPDVQDRYTAIGILSEQLTKKVRAQNDAERHMRRLAGKRGQGANRQISVLVDGYLPPGFAGMCTYEMTRFCNWQRLPLPEALMGLLSVLLGEEEFKGISENQRMA